MRGQQFLLRLIIIWFRSKGDKVPIMVYPGLGRPSFPSPDCSSGHSSQVLGPTLFQLQWARLVYAWRLPWFGLFHLLLCFAIGTWRIYSSFSLSSFLVFRESLPLEKQRRGEIYTNWLIYMEQKSETPNYDNLNIWYADNLHQKTHHLHQKTHRLEWVIIFMIYWQFIPFRCLVILCKYGAKCMIF